MTSSPKTTDPAEMLRKLKHDLKNPLAIISGNTQLIQVLLSDKEGMEQVADSVADIQAACQQMEALVERLAREGEGS